VTRGSEVAVEKLVIGFAKQKNVDLSSSALQAGLGGEAAGHVMTHN
jgi:hypothetical protein